MFDGKFWALIIPVITRWTAYFCALARLLQVNKALKVTVFKHYDVIMESVGKKVKMKARAARLLAHVQSKNWWKQLTLYVNSDSDRENDNGSETIDHAQLPGGRTVGPYLFWTCLSLFLTQVRLYFGKRYIPLKDLFNWSVEVGWDEFWIHGNINYQQEMEFYELATREGQGEPAVEKENTAIDVDLT